MYGNKIPVRVSTEMVTLNTNQRWTTGFNSVTFFNYDTNNAVTINQFVIPPAVASGGDIYPTFLEISLNRGEINDSYYDIKFVKDSTTNKLCVVYSLYNHGLEDRNHA